MEAVQEGGALKGIAAVVSRGVPIGAGTTLNVFAESIPEAWQPKGGEEVFEAIIVLCGGAKEGERLCAPSA